MKKPLSGVTESPAGRGQRLSHVFAFDQRQFAEGMRRLGLRPSGHESGVCYRWHRWILPQKRCAEAT